MLSTTCWFSRHQSCYLSDMCAIKQRKMTKYNKVTDKVKSSDIRNILINNTKIKYKNYNKNRLQILEEMIIKYTKNKK